MSRLSLFIFFIVIALSASSQDPKSIMIDNAVDAIEQEVIKYRHHFHEFPELSNREFKTSDKIVEILKSMGYKPEQGMAHTGVVAVLNSGKPGPTIG